MKQTETRGAMSPNEIIAIAVAILLSAIILPIAFVQLGLANDNSTSWGPSGTVIATLLVTVVPVLAVLGIALKFTGRI